MITGDSPPLGSIAGIADALRAESGALDDAFSRVIRLVRRLRMQIAPLVSQPPTGREAEARRLNARATAQISRLVAMIQANDTADQRVDHVVSALMALEGRSAEEAAPVLHVLTRQLDALVELLTDLSASAERAFEGLIEAIGPVLADDPVQIHAAVGDPLGDWGPIRTRLVRAERTLAMAAAGLSRCLTVPIGPEAMREADLDWLMQLYTMEAERETHSVALTG